MSESVADKLTGTWAVVVAWYIVIALGGEPNILAIAAGSTVGFLLFGRR